MSESDVCRRQILTSKVDPRAVSVKIFIMFVDPSQIEKNPLISMVYTKLFQRFKGLIMALARDTELIYIQCQVGISSLSYLLGTRLIWVGFGAS